MPAGIYVHIPFCLAKCPYCDFYSIVGDDSLVDIFAKAILTEIDILAKSKWKDRVYNSIYIGGGTPPLLGDKNISDLLQTLRQNFNISPRSEITIEVNPEMASLSSFESILASGVNRISIGVQSFDDSLLKTLGRIHTAETAAKAVEIALVAGFDNVSLDLMFGIPGQTMAVWQATLNQAIAKNPKHVSAYCLTIENDTPFDRLVKNGELKLLSNEIQAEMYSLMNETLSSAGLKRYEVSNFAQTGFECRHNFKYWKDDKYVGLGPAAHSYDGERRTANYKNFDKYLFALEKGKLPVNFKETLSDKQRAEERLLLGLRLADGVEYNLVREILNEKQLAEFIKQGYIRKKINKIALTDKGFLMADDVIVKLMKG
jgi:oxygen-independent coproporphyrinogen-3 oxidase